MISPPLTSKPYTGSASASLLTRAPEEKEAEERKDLNNGSLEEISIWKREAEISFNINIAFMMAKIKKEPFTRA